MGDRGELLVEARTNAHQDLRAHHVEQALEKVEAYGECRKRHQRRHAAAGQGTVVDLEHVECAGQRKDVDDPRDAEEIDADSAEFPLEQVRNSSFRYRLGVGIAHSCTPLR
jgi:hypothetical protein